MIWQVSATLYFDKPDEASDFYNDCEKAYAKARDINLDQPNFEGKIIQLVENHHDESPLAPCQLLLERRTHPD